LRKRGEVSEVEDKGKSLSKDVKASIFDYAPRSGL